MCVPNTPPVAFISTTPNAFDYRAFVNESVRMTRYIAHALADDEAFRAARCTPTSTSSSPMASFLQP